MGRCVDVWYLPIICEPLSYLTSTFSRLTYRTVRSGAHRALPSLTFLHRLDRQLAGLPAALQRRALRAPLRRRLLASPPALGRIPDRLRPHDGQPRRDVLASAPVPGGLRRAGHGLSTRAKRRHSQYLVCTPARAGGGPGDKWQRGGRSRAAYSVSAAAAAGRLRLDAEGAWLLEHGDAERECGGHAAAAAAAEEGRVVCVRRVEGAAVCAVLCRHAGGDAGVLCFPAVHSERESSTFCIDCSSC